MPTKLLLGLTLVSVCQAAEKKPEITWNKQFDAAMETARSTGKPVLMDFWASWCGPCKQMDREVWPDRRVQELSTKFVCIWVDVDKEKAAPGRYLVQAIPTVIVADPWGKTLARREGTIQPREVVEMMQSVPADYSAVREYGDILQRNGKDATALYRMGTFYGKNRLINLSTEYYRDALKTPEAKSNMALQTELEISIGLNNVRKQDWKGAAKSLDAFLKAYPDSPHCEQALLGLCIAQSKLGKTQEAKRTAAALESRFPQSEMLPSVRKLTAN